MSSNFGTGQSLFGGSTSNQNKNQSTPNPGSTPAPPSIFGNLGANTTSSAAFGGAGAGSAPSGGGTASGTAGNNIFGTGGSAFGGAGNANTTTTPNPAGAGAGTGSSFGGPSLFPAKPATTTGSSGTTVGGGLFGNTSSNTGTLGKTTGQSNLFGNTTGTNAGTTGGPLFGFPPPKPATTGGGIFGSGTGGTSNTASGGAPGGSLFGGATTSTGGIGASNATSSTAPATGMPASSNTGGLFGGTKPVDSAAKPATSTFFSAPTSGTGLSTGTAAAGGGTSLFAGLGPKPGETSTPTPAQPSSLPGGSLFKPPVTGATAPTQATSTQPAFSLGGAAATGDKAASITGTAGGGLFPNLGANAKKDGASTTAPSTFSLGGQPAGTATAPAASTTEKRDGSGAPSLFSGLSGTTAGAAKPATPLPGSASTASHAGTMALPTTTTSTLSVPPPSMHKGKSIEEIINRWSTELETHVRDFNKFATEVAVWDRSLIENGNNLAALYSNVLAAEREQNDIDQSLDHIEQQEKELTATVDMYEKQMAEILGGQGGNLRTLDTGPADTERDKNYMLATELHNHLDDLSSSLTELIESVNSMSLGQGDTKTTSAEDPMAQIAQVLGNHLDSLQWIDGASRELEEKVVEVEKRIRDVGGVPHGAPAPGGGSRSRGFGLTR